MQERAWPSDRRWTSQTPNVLYHETFSHRTRRRAVRLFTPIFDARLREPVGGQTPTWLRRMRWPPKKSSRSRSVWSQKGLQRRCLVNRCPMPPGAPSPALKKPMCSPCLGVNLLQVRSGGPYGGSLLPWSSGRVSPRCPLRLCDGHEKKCT